MRSLGLTEQQNSKDTTSGKKFIYRGSSMRSTFTQGHVLYIRPESKKPQPGDVIVYRRGEEFVVHRVNAVSQEGIQTRGDNNPRYDEIPVDEKQIIGIVERVDDGKNTHLVIGGRWGLFLARLRWGFSAVVNWMRPVIGAPYRWLKSFKLIAKLWHPKILQVKTNSSSGPMIKYIAGGKTVATWTPNLKCFQCNRLYDLVIFPPG